MREQDPVFYDALFRQKRKGGKWRVMPSPVLEGPVADTHAHLQMLADPACELARAGAHGVAFAGVICVLGAGGVGRMFALACARQGARVTVAVRESGREKASELLREAREKLGAELSVRGIDALDGRFSLLINGTPVGMYPNTDACPVPPALLDGVDTVFDCVYNPSETLLLRHARERGVKAVGGMEMLVWQAAIAHEIWHGTRFSDRAVGRIVEEMAAYLLLKEQTP